MPMPKAWLIESFGITLARSVAGLVPKQATEARIPLDVIRESVSPVTEKIDESIARGLGAIGAVIGSPLGFFPMLMNFYQSGQAQDEKYATQKAMETARLEPRDLFTLMFRGQISEVDLDRWLEDVREQGWSEDRITALKEASRPILDLSSIRDLFLRGEFGAGEDATKEATRRITALGFKEPDAIHIIKLFYYIPPASEMIRMVVREAWRDDIAAIYGTDEGYETLPFEQFAKAGLSPEWLKAEWRSHWILPSVGQAFEMLHRGVIDEEELDTLLHTQDIMPFWRPRLKEIAYNPFTRVDVRRMYKLGVLDEAEVLQSYKDIGYNADKAQKMLDFTIEYTNKNEATVEDELKELTRAQIITAYREKVIERPTAQSYLEEITYPEEIADLLLTIEDTKDAEREQKAALGFIGRAYALGTMTRENMLNELGKLDLTGAQQDYYMVKFDRDLVTKAKRPTVADLRAWFKAKIIAADEFTNEMLIEGYPMYYITKYIKGVKL